MAMRCALAGTATTVAIVAGLGNPATVDAAREADHDTLGLTLAEFASWDVADLTGEEVGAIVLRLSVLLVAVALLSALAGRSRSRGAAFVGGWGAVVVAAALAGAATYAYQVAVVLDGQTLDLSYLGGLANAVNTGATFGLWTGWLVGVAVAVAVPAERTAAAATTHRRSARSTPPRGTPQPARAFAEPPPPWWAPARVDGNGAVVEPGPTVFPPGGLRPDRVAVAGLDDATQPAVFGGAAGPRPSPGPAGGATHQMTTASGDPHPSDPDATRAVAATATNGRGGGDHDSDATAVDTPDVTATIDTSGADHTVPTLRPAD